MATTQYIGSRYVPLFADPAEWNNTRAYEPLTIVLHEGNSYTSKQYVPKGIDITNADFWAETGNYNAQVEQYRKEVANYDARITTADGTANNALSLAQTNKQDIATLDAQMAGTQDSGLKTSIDTVSATQAKVRRIKFSKCITFGDSWERGMYPEDGTEKEHVGQGWMTQCAIALGVDASNIINYASSGAGFALTKYNVLNNLGFATDEDLKDCDLILIGAGLNDTDLSSARNNAINCVKKLCNDMLPKCADNCEVHFFVGNAPVYMNGQTSFQIWNGIIQALEWAIGYYQPIEKGIICVHNCVYRQTPRFSVASDNRHLTQNGYIQAGGWCAERIMSGGDHYPTVYSALQAVNSNWNVTVNQLIEINGVAYLEFKATASSEQVVATDIGQLPEPFRCGIDLSDENLSYSTGSYQFRIKNAATSVAFSKSWVLGI